MTKFNIINGNKRKPPAPTSKNSHQQPPATPPYQNIFIAKDITAIAPQKQTVRLKSIHPPEIPGIAVLPDKSLPLPPTPTVDTQIATV